jgi:hypothetical protein
LLKEGKKTNVHVRVTRYSSIAIATRLEVFAALVGQSIEKPAVSDRVPLATMRAASVESNGFVPSDDRIVVAVNAFNLAVIKGILKFAKDIHPNIHVSGSLLGGLCKC